jgi:hypothetical protein
MESTSTWIVNPDTLADASQTQHQWKRYHRNVSPRGMGKASTHKKHKKTVLALVTIRALFGIEFVGGHAEHIIALDANAVQDGRFGRHSRTLFLFGPLGFGSIHDRGILPRGEALPAEMPGLHPGVLAGHLTK